EAGDLGTGVACREALLQLVRHCRGQRALRGRRCGHLMAQHAAEEDRESGGAERRRPHEKPGSHGFWGPFVLSKPLNGIASYGNDCRFWTSFPSTPSPSGRLWPISAPPTARSEMSITSSPSRRPFG